MLAFPANLRILLAVDPVDMRKQFNGLWAEAQHRLGEDPFGGSLFVFTNKRRNMVKLLYWDSSIALASLNSSKTVNRKWINTDPKAALTKHKCRNGALLKEWRFCSRAIQ